MCTVRIIGQSKFDFSHKAVKILGRIIGKASVTSVRARKIIEKTILIAYLFAEKVKAAVAADDIEIRLIVCVLYLQTAFGAMIRHHADDSPGLVLCQHDRKIPIGKIIHGFAVYPGNISFRCL